MRPHSPSRINVVGSSGSGKTTFSRKLGAELSLPVIEMDALFWGPAWQKTPDEAFNFRLESALAADTWVLDGNYNRTQPIKWQRVELVIWLDYAFPRVLLQAVTRAVRRSLTREEIWPGTGNRESFHKSFCSRESIILWSVQNFRRVRRRYAALAADPQRAIPIVRLRSPGEADRWLHEWLQVPRTGG